MSTFLLVFLMVNIIRVPGNSQVYVDMQYDAAQAKWHILNAVTVSNASLSTLNNGLVCCFPMEEASGNRIDDYAGKILTLSGAAFDSTDTGIIDRSLLYSVGSSLSKNLLTNELGVSSADANLYGFTLSFWAKVNWVGAVDEECTMEIDLLGTDQMFPSNKQLILEIIFKGYPWNSDIESYGTYFKMQSAYIPTGPPYYQFTEVDLNWLDQNKHLFVVVYDPADHTMKVYKDNALAGTATGVNEIIDLKYLEIFDWGNNSPTVEGRLDQVNLWKRVLTSAEMTELWNGGNGIHFAHE